MELKSFTYTHIIHWEFWGGRGSLGHSPSMKGNQTVNGSAGALLALSPSPGVFPWEPLAL